MFTLCLCLLGPLSKMTQNLPLKEQCRILAEHCKAVVITKHIPLHESQLKLLNADPIPPSLHKGTSRKVKNFKSSTNTKNFPIMLAGVSKASHKDFFKVMYTCVNSVSRLGYLGKEINMHKISLALCREFERAVQLSRWCVACFLVSVLRLVEQKMILKPVRCADELQHCVVELNKASNLFLKLVRHNFYSATEENRLAKLIAVSHYRHSKKNRLLYNLM